VPSSFRCGERAERLPQPPQVGPGLELESLGQALMDPPADLVGKLGDRGLSDQVMRRLRRPARLDDDAAIDELAQRSFQTRERPLRERRRVREGERARGDSEQAQKRRRVGAGATLLHRQDMAEADSQAAGSGERLKPERRSICLLPELAGKIPIAPRVEPEHELDSFLSAQRRQLDPCDALGRQRLGEHHSAAARSSRREDHDTLARTAGGADQLVSDGGPGGHSVFTWTLLQALGGILPRDGRLPAALREGVQPPTEEERAAWNELTPGAQILTEAGAVPYDERAADEFYLRTTSEPSVDVNGILGGKPGLRNTTIPVSAQANFSVRLAPGQEPEPIRAAVDRLVHEAAPAGAEVTLTLDAFAPPGLVPPEEPAVQIALDAFEQVFRRRPLLARSGGTLPIVPALADQGIPTILTGIALPESNIHSPNERLLLEYLPLGVDVARELFKGLASLH